MERKKWLNSCPFMNIQHISNYLRTIVDNYNDKNKNNIIEYKELNDQKLGKYRILIQIDRPDLEILLNELKNQGCNDIIMQIWVPKPYIQYVWLVWKNSILK